RHMSRTAVIAETDRLAAELGGLPCVHDLTLTDVTVQLHLDGVRFNFTIRALTPLSVRRLSAHRPLLENPLIRPYSDGRLDSPLAAKALSLQPQHHHHTAHPPLT